MHLHGEHGRETERPTLKTLRKLGTWAASKQAAAGKQQMVGPVGPAHSISPAPRLASTWLLGRPSGPLRSRSCGLQGGLGHAAAARAPAAKQAPDAGDCGVQPAMRGGAGRRV